MALVPALPHRPSKIVRIPTLLPPQAPAAPDSAICHANQRRRGGEADRETLLTLDISAVGRRSRIGIPAGTLDEDPGIRPQGHIFVEFKAPWFEITDSLPQFAREANG